MAGGITTRIGSIRKTRGSPDRRYGYRQDPGHLLTLTETDENETADSPRRQATYRFVPVLGEDMFYLLAPCPHCTRPVPAAEISTLAELGSYLDPSPDRAHPTTDAFGWDLNHAPDCPATLHDTTGRAGAGPAPDTPPATSQGV